ELATVDTAGEEHGVGAGDVGVRERADCQPERAAPLMLVRSTAEAAAPLLVAGHEPEYGDRGGRRFGVPIANRRANRHGPLASEARTVRRRPEHMVRKPRGRDRRWR